MRLSEMAFPCHVCLSYPSACAACLYKLYHHIYSLIFSYFPALSYTSSEYQVVVVVVAFLAYSRCVLCLMSRKGYVVWVGGGGGKKG